MPAWREYESNIREGILTMTSGWDESAQAWIASMGEDGDWGRRHVLDGPMLARLRARGFKTAVDIGCGEGRFCREMKKLGMKTIGIDPTVALIERAKALDPTGIYHRAAAESLPLDDASADLALCYLSLIDIADIGSAFSEIHRVLAPGGTLLIANLQSFNTAGPPTGWTREANGVRRFYIDRYLDERVQTVSWSGIRVQNWHRPLSAYMKPLIGLCFTLTHFDEPEPVGAEPEKAERYRRVPFFLMMEWRKGAAP